MNMQIVLANGLCLSHVRHLCHMHYADEASPVILDKYCHMYVLPTYIVVMLDKYCHMYVLLHILYDLR